MIDERNVLYPMHRDILSLFIESKQCIIRTKEHITYESTHPLMHIVVNVVYNIEYIPTTHQITYTYKH